MKKKLIAALLTLVMIVSLLPTVALAEDANVAEVNGTGYPTLQAAVDAASDNDTIRILQDIVIDIPEEKLNHRYYYCTIDGKTLTLDLNGKTINWCDAAASQTGDEYDVVFVLKNGANVTLTGDGTIDGRNVGKMCSSAAWLIDKTKNRLTVKNGTFYEELIFFVFTGCGEILVEGGYFSDPTYQGNCQLFNVSGYLAFADETKVTMTGGTLDCRDPRYLNDGNAVAEGYAVRKVTKADGKRDYTVVPASEVAGYYNAATADYDYNHKNNNSSWKAKYGTDFPAKSQFAYLVEDAVAKIGDTYYRSLYSAVYKSQPGDTVTVLKDIEIGLNDLYFDSTVGGISYYTWVYVTGKDLTLDLNNHTIRIAESAKNKANSQYRLFLLSNDSNMTVTGNGKIVGDAGNPGAVNIFNLSKQGNSSGGCLTIENGEFSTVGAEIVYAFPTNHCEIKGGTFEGLGEDYSKNRALNCNGGGSTNNYAFSITGGTYVDFDPRNMDDGNLVADGCCVKESTRASDDATLYTVAVCGESQVGEVTTQPTYTEEGERTYYCANCGKVMDTEPIEKLDPLPVIGAIGSVIEDDDIDFVDVSARDYFYKAVCWAVKNDITTGTSRRYFSPDDACTRAQAVTFLWRAAGEPRANGTNPFTDVSVSDYYYEAVLWAVSEGIVKGTSDTTFSPNAECSRAQIVTMLYRAAGEPVGYVNAGFTDVTSGAYYAEAVAWAVVEGITDGTGEKTFSPDATCTRAQIVTFLYRS